MATILLALLLSACAAAAPTQPATPTADQLSSTIVAGALASLEAPSAGAAVQPTAVTILPAPTATPKPAAATAQPDPAQEMPVFTDPPGERKTGKYWPEWPLVPTVSARAKEIFWLGQQMGNDPHSFTTIGDCQSEPDVFMGVYDTDTYQLGAGYEYLDETVKQFKGSFGRDSITVKDGLSVASALSPTWADPVVCQQGETPLECEFRLHKPVIVFINLGTNWRGGDEVKHEEYLRQVVDIAIHHGVLPVLSTKGDNLEGGHRINESIARVAYDYQLPLWNFWLSIRDLPGGGLDDTRPGGYLTPDAWGRRSFTGLQALDAVWRELKPIVEESQSSRLQ